MTGEMAAVGEPLIEQDAEYLAGLLRRHGFDARLKHIEDAAGRNWLVTVDPDHRADALRVRADEFSEPARGPTKRKRPKRWGRAVFLGVAGLLMGLRVGVKLRGGPIVTLLVAGGLGLLAVAASMVFNGGPKQTLEEDVTVDAASEPEDKQQRANEEQA